MSSFWTLADKLYTYTISSSVIISQSINQLLDLQINNSITLASSLCLHSVQNSYSGAEVQIGCCSEISQGSSHSLPSTCNFTSTIPLFGQVLFLPRGRTTMAQTRAFSTIGPPLECHPSLSLINLAFCISSASFKICHQNEWTSAGTSIPWGEWSRNLYQSQFRVEK